MSKYVKELLQKELEEKLEKERINEFVVFSIQGVDGTDNNAMRGRLKEKGIGFFIVKNSLFRRALRNKDMESAAEVIEGPCAIAYVHEGCDLVEVARELLECQKAIPKVEIKGAYIEGSLLDGEGAREFSRLPTRAEMQGKILASILSVGGRFSGSLSGPAGIVAGCVKAVSEEGEKKAA